MSNKPGHPESNPEPDNLSQETAEQEQEQEQKTERDGLPKGAVAHSGTGTIKVTG